MFNKTILFPVLADPAVGRGREMGPNDPAVRFFDREVVPELGPGVRGVTFVGIGVGHLVVQRHLDRVVSAVPRD